MPPKARSAASSGAKPKKKANGYKFPEKLPCGEVLEDSSKKQWILGESIGQGGFGEIYCASEPGTKNKWPFVIKIEPHENGPLFMEKNFYIKVAKPDDVKSWKQKEGMKTLGIPMYLGSGTYLHKGSEKYRFLVIDRYGKDLWSLFLKSKVFPPQTVYKIALQIIDALRYIHSKGYVHGDIKGQNLLLGLAPGTENQVFLVDFGLACKYSQKEFQRDPKKAHNGTIEYTSCDMHMGVPTRRGDLEILGYNLLHWLSGSLPWERDLSKCEIVHKKKQELMENVNAYISSNFSNIPQVIIEYMEYVSKLKHDQEPDYKYIEQLFIKELKKIGASKTGPLEFESKPAATTTPKRTSVKRTVGEEGGQGRRTTPKRGAAAKFIVDSDEEEEVDLAVHKKSKVTKKTTLKAAVKKATAVVSDEEEDSPTQVVKSKANSKPKVHTSSAMSTVGKRRAPKPNVALSDEDMFESEGSDFEDSGTSKPKRSTKKAVSNGHPKSTKRSAASAGSPSKKTKTTKNTKPPLTKKLDYRDAPKCLLPGIREEN